VVLSRQRGLTRSHQQADQRYCDDASISSLWTETVFRVCPKLSMPTAGSFKLSGDEFHTDWPATEKQSKHNNIEMINWPKILSQMTCEPPDKTITKLAALSNVTTHTFSLPHSTQITYRNTAWENTRCDKNARGKNMISAFRVSFILCSGTYPRKQVQWMFMWYCGSQHLQSESHFMQ